MTVVAFDGRTLAADKRAMILAIDPGPLQSGWVKFDGRVVHASGVHPNDVLLRTIATWQEPFTTLAIEKIEAMGMAVGAEVFETVFWSGRFMQAWDEPSLVKRITRRQVKLGLCGNMRAKDPNIRQALIDMLGAPGTKKAPGATYGVTSHAWSALAVAVIAAGGDNLPRPFEAQLNEAEVPF